jgi:type VI secretion system protein ImpA
MSEPILDFTTLLNPIAGENPSGESLRYDGTYDQIKEARREDEVFAQGDWSRDLKVAEWNKVIQLATAALTNKTKDLQIAAWLVEGLAKHDKQDRWVGLRDGLQLMRSLQESFWETLYPEIDPEDDEGSLAARANVIASMEQRLAGFVKELPLIAGAQYSYLNYLDSKQFDIPENFASLEFEQQEKLTALKAQAEAEKKTTGEDWRKAKTATSRDFIEARLSLINEVWDQLQALDAVMDEKFARETPGVGTLKKSLDEIRTLVELVAKEKRAAEPRADETPEEFVSEDGVSAGGGGGFSSSTGAVRNRQEALRKLSEVAEYFLNSEPHSPVSYLVQRAVKWGSMPLDAWLADVLKEGAALETMRETLGMNTNNGYE